LLIKKLKKNVGLPQPGGPGSRIYIPQEQGGPVIPAGTGLGLKRTPYEVQEYTVLADCRTLKIYSVGTSRYNRKN
jgi:hypothetical protein